MWLLFYRNISYKNVNSLKWCVLTVTGVTGVATLVLWINTGFGFVSPSGMNSFNGKSVLFHVSANNYAPILQTIEVDFRCAAPTTAPVITRAKPVNTKSFTVSWKITEPSHRYMITWTNLRTDIKSNVTVTENTNSYIVTGLSGIDNYNVTVTANNSCGMMMSDPITVYGKLYPHVELDVSQKVVWPPMVDAIKLQMTCKAIVKNGHKAITFVAIDWTGGDVHKSAWINLMQVKEAENHIERAVLFKPWLESHAGIYTCHLVIKDEHHSIFMMHKTIEVKGEYRGLINSRFKSQKFDSAKIMPSKWFPNTDLCGQDNVWQEYADFHASVLSGKQKGKYLIYDCTVPKADICGGYGNRIQSINILLILAMVTKHVFLIESTYPTDINDYFLPNAIQWNYTVPKGLKTNIVYTYYAAASTAKVEHALLHPDEQDVVRVRTFLGIFYYIQLVSDGTIKDMISKFNLKTHYDCILLYGCVFRYLFKYQPMVQQRIKSLQKEYNLETKKFITLHVRSHFHDNGHHISNPLHLKFPFKPMFDCAVMVEKSLSDKLNVSKVPIFLASDESEITDYAKQNYKDLKMVFSQAAHFHIDRTKYNAKEQYDDGVIGILSDIDIGSKGAVLIRSIDSSFSEEMGGIHFLRPENNLHPFYFYENLTICQL